LLPKDFQDFFHSSMHGEDAADEGDDDDVLVLLLLDGS
jgi:hypothetical protein